MLQSKASYEKLIADHQRKLADCKANLLAHDNEGLLENAPSVEIRQNTIEGRVMVLVGRIGRHEGELAKIKMLRRD